MKAIAAVAMIGLLLVLGACSSQAAHGSVHGTLLITGGMRDVEKAVPGLVTIRSSDGKTTVVTVGRDGRFRISVPRGSYSLTGRSPNFGPRCFGQHHVAVHSGSTVAINVLCQMM